MNIRLFFISMAAAALLTAPVPASAELVNQHIGHVQASLGVNYGRELDAGGSEDHENVSSIELEASYSYPITDRFSIAGDFRYRRDGYSEDSSSDQFGTDAPKWDYVVGLHPLMNVGKASRIGAFMAYGDTRNNDDNKSDSYDVIMLGLEGQSFIADNVFVYGQLGGADKRRAGDDDDEGFNQGWVSRVGGNYFATNRLALGFDAELAASKNYIDSDDPGRFHGYTISGEFRMMNDVPLYFGGFGRYDVIDATDEGDGVEEKTVGISLKYYFGKGQATSSSAAAARAGRSIGMPRMPTRGSIWTEWID